MFAAMARLDEQVHLVKASKLGTRCSKLAWLGLQNLTASQGLKNARKKAANSQSVCGGERITLTSRQPATSLLEPPKLRHSASHAAFVVAIRKNRSSAWAYSSNSDPLPGHRRVAMNPTICRTVKGLRANLLCRFRLHRCRRRIRERLLPQFTGGLGGWVGTYVHTYLRVPYVVPSICTEIPRSSDPVSDANTRLTTLHLESQEPTS